MASPIEKSAAGAPMWNSATVELLSISILVFSLALVIVITIYLTRREGQANDITRVAITISIVGVSAFLIVAGYTTEQITPVIGLFGAIVGYILGKDASK